MNDNEIIDLTKNLKGIKSDYGLAKTLNMTPQNISRVRRNEGKLSGDTLMKIGKLLDINPNDLVELEKQELISKKGFNKGE